MTMSLRTVIGAYPPHCESVLSYSSRRSSHIRWGVIVPAWMIIKGAKNNSRVLPIHAAFGCCNSLICACS